MLDDKAGKKTLNLKEKKQENSGELSKSRQMSQIHNSLNSRPRFTQQVQFLINLILIGQSKSKKKKQLKRFKKTQIILKIS
jgi:hypothetical protein